MKAFMTFLVLRSMAKKCGGMIDLTITVKMKTFSLNINMKDRWRSYLHYNDFDNFLVS